MSGTCYYCGKPAIKKGRLQMTDEPVWLCSFHYSEVVRIETRTGAGAGIG